MEILEHEKVHVNQNHTIDVLLCEVLCIVFWWNPFAWMIRKEIKTNLEYLADRGVLEEGFNPRNYQYTLLQITTQQKNIPIINYFNVSELKKRIAMMNKKKTSIIVSVKYFLVLPLVLGLLLTNCSMDNQSEKEQEQDNPVEAVTDIIVHDKEDVEVVTSQEAKKPFTAVEKMPSYPGGEKAMLGFIQSNLKYPETAQEAEIQGRVVIRFNVSRDGEIKDIEVLRGLDPACDDEAVRVMKKMPRWIPGEHHGEKVDVYFTIPIVFKLQ